MFRNFRDYGYIVDNSMFGYRFVDDTSTPLEEKIISQTGAVMLGVLQKFPQDIETIVKRLLGIFVGVGYDVLKQDTITFFGELAEDGYLAYGTTYEMCEEAGKLKFSKKRLESDDTHTDYNSNSGEMPLRLKSVHIDLTNMCNERCVHCYIPRKQKNVFMAGALFDKIIADAVDANVLNITISGGEPLLHPEIIDFLRKCREHDFSVNVLTNLTLLTDDIADEMTKNPLLSVQTSIYSMIDTIHDRVTQIEGSLQKTKTAVKKLLSFGVPLQISCPVVKQTKNSFADVVKWGKAHNIYTVENPVIFAKWDHTNENLDSRLTLAEIEEVITEQLSDEYVNYLHSEARDKLAKTGEMPICEVCREYFCVAPNGTVYPCVGWQNKIVGNVNKQSLQEVWNTSEEIRYLRRVKREDFPQCVTCDDRGYCTVCMMRNANENSDGDIFKISKIYCSYAELLHKKAADYGEGKNNGNL